MVDMATFIMKKMNKPVLLFLEKKDFIYLLLERREGRKEERERNINVPEIHGWVASHTPPAGGLACNPGMFPAWESNREPLGLQASAQSTEPHEPHQAGLFCFFSKEVTLDL